MTMKFTNSHDIAERLASEIITSYVFNITDIKKWKIDLDGGQLSASYKINKIGLIDDERQFIFAIWLFSPSWPGYNGRHYCGRELNLPIPILTLVSEIQGVIDECIGTNIPSQ